MQALPFLELMYCIEQYERERKGKKKKNSAKLKLRTSVLYTHFQLELLV